MNSPHTPWRAFSSHAIIESDLAPLWARMSDFGGLAELVPDMVESCRLEGQGVGAERQLKFRDGKTARETLISLHPEAFRFAYSMQDPSPFPWTQYFSTHQLQPLGAGQTHYHITGFYHPMAGQSPAAMDILDTVYRAIFEGAAKALRARLSLRPEE